MRDGDSTQGSIASGRSGLSIYSLESLLLRLCQSACFDRFRQLVQSRKLREQKLIRNITEEPTSK